MSTGYENVTQRRFSLIARMKESVFHADDLAVLWGITNKNTLYTTLSRYVRQGLLFRIYRGLYAIAPLSALDPVRVGIRALHGSAYVSTETVLARDGIIQQSVPVLTLVSAQSRSFTIGKTRYRSRRLQDRFLMNVAGIAQVPDGTRTASTPRAIADMLYFDPKYHFDRTDLVDWNAVRAMQEAIGYPPTPARYAHSS